MSRASVEVYCLIAGEYQLLPANERDHFPISQLGVELGIWQGRYQNAEAPWLRWWDEQGNLLLTGWERAEQTQLELQQEQQKVERLMAQLRAQGIEPDTEKLI